MLAIELQNSKQDRKQSALRPQTAAPTFQWEPSHAHGCSQKQSQSIPCVSQHHTVTQEAKEAQNPDSEAKQGRIVNHEHVAELSRDIGES